jgi:hypothetical protein
MFTWLAQLHALESMHAGAAALQRASRHVAPPYKCIRRAGVAPTTSVYCNLTSISTAAAGPSRSQGSSIEPSLSDDLSS